MEDVVRVRLVRGAVVAASATMFILLLVVGWNSTEWVGRTFPGFLVLGNRVVPSIALPEWTDGPPSVFFQHEVVEIDGRPIVTADAIYAHVAGAPPGTVFVYRLRAPSGVDQIVPVGSRRFGGRDYVFLFGAFVCLGLVFFGTGAWVAFVAPRTPASLGLLSSGTAAGLFALTAVDLYGPWWFMRLHVVAETWLAAGFLHLAAVFPTDRFGARRRPILIALYAVFGLVALAYEAALDTPRAYSLMHLLVTAAHGVAALLVIVAVVHDYLRSPSALVRRRISVVALGTAAGMLAPAVTMGASALLGGRVAVNLGVLPALLFPISVGYAIVKQDLFEIDVLLRRATTYVIVVALAAGCYLALLALMAMLVPGTGTLAATTPLSALVNLAIILVLWPLQRRVQATVDQLFFRGGYDSESALAELSRGLASAHTRHAVLAQAEAVLSATVRPTHWATYWEDGDGAFRRIVGSHGPERLTLPPGLATRAAEGRILTRYEWEDGVRTLPEVWRSLDAELLIPIRSWGPPIAFLALGGKASGHPYGTYDDTFLRAAASQLALALTSAQAFAELEALNARLEEQVRDRTRALESANVELNESLDELRNAYTQLEKNQTSLLRADRLATLGRLAAGIAHEVNTPLGAVHNSLRVTTDLAQEYLDSIDDPQVTRDDHRAIARELLEAAQAAAGWARKASSFIAKVKLHSRETPSDPRSVFRVADVVAETEALLSHRLRSAECRLTRRLDDDLALRGDPTRFGQVLVNLVGNAIDAYEEHGVRDGVVAVALERTDDAVRLTVTDHAGGISPDVLPRIFEELYTTKEPGRGTGLGLWIARQLVEETFGGTLTVVSAPGQPTCFTITMPASRIVEKDARPAA
jgi:signal transduction histidine kinase